MQEIVCVCENARNSTLTAERRRREATKKTPNRNNSTSATAPQPCIGQSRHRHAHLTSTQLSYCLPKHTNKPELLQRTHTLQTPMLHLVMVRRAPTPVQQRVHTITDATPQ